MSLPTRLIKAIDKYSCTILSTSVNLLTKHIFCFNAKLSRIQTNNILIVTILIRGSQFNKVLNCDIISTEKNMSPFNLSKVKDIQQSQFSSFYNSDERAVCAIRTFLSAKLRHVRNFHQDICEYLTR